MLVTNLSQLSHSLVLLDYVSMLELSRSDLSSKPED